MKFRRFFPPPSPPDDSAHQDHSHGPGQKKVKSRQSSPALFAAVAQKGGLDGSRYVDLSREAGRSSQSLIHGAALSAHAAPPKLTAHHTYTNTHTPPITPTTPDTPNNIPQQPSIIQVHLDAPTSNNHTSSQASDHQTATEGHRPAPPAEASARRFLRRPQPGLLARLTLLTTRRRTTCPPAFDPNYVGRLPESKIREFDTVRTADESEVPRRGQLSSGLTPPRVETSLPAQSKPDAQIIKLDHSFQSSVMAALSHHDDTVSDMSSVLSSDHPVLSESDDDILDTQKYRLPDVGKSRGSSRNGFAMPDGRNIEREKPPSPPPKDPLYAPQRVNSFPSTESFSDQFNPYGLQRTGSIYTLSRASLSNQLSQLTSIKLPEASSLESSISSIPSSIAAARVLNDAAGQIKIWITKANEVLDGLDAEDDVEWSAAAGREGLAEVDQAINVFNSLIVVFVNAIENLESRPDIGNLPTRDQTAIVDRMEKILEDWEKIKKTLEGVKEQVEVAMEWEELWNTVLGEIGQEEEGLNRLIFEMEERRHKNSLLDAMAEPGQSLDIKELETIVEEAPARAANARAAANRLSLLVADEPAAPQPPQTQEDSNLLALTARMQPLRASLDFLPMRLAGFLHRGKDTFPTACEELETRMNFLEAKYQKLEADAEALRKELGEDRWVLIFRKAGRQALKMCESVERSVAKLRESLDEGTHHTNPPALAKKIENYEAKKEHYGPAIQQVLAIIDRGVSTRLTVNGEILRLQTDMQRRWADLGSLIKSMNFALDQLNISRTRQLRDSVSTVLSEQRSIASSTGTLVDTPGSSPASSVVLLARRPSDQETTTPYSNKSRQSSFTSTATTRGKRLSSLPTPSHNAPRQSLGARASTSQLRVTGASARLYPGPPPRSESRSQSRQGQNATSIASRPRWNSSTNTSDVPLGHNFKPLSATNPSPYAKSPTLRSPKSFNHSLTNSTIPSPLGRSVHEAGGHPPPSTTPGLRPASRLTLRPKVASAQTSMGIAQSYRNTHPADPATPVDWSRSVPSSSYITPTSTPAAGRNIRHLSHSSINSNTSNSTLTERQTALATPQDTPSSVTGAEQPMEESPSSRTAARPALGSRPGTATANRRISLLPQPKRAVSSVATAAAASAMANAPPSTPGRHSRVGSSTSIVNGRSSQMGRGTSMGFQSVTDERPRWKH
jgi:hypothetical protein